MLEYSWKRTQAYRLSLEALKPEEPAYRKLDSSVLFPFELFKENPKSAIEILGRQSIGIEVTREVNLTEKTEDMKRI